MLYNNRLAHLVAFEYLRSAARGDPHNLDLTQGYNRRTNMFKLELPKFQQLDSDIRQS